MPEAQRRDTGTGLGGIGFCGIGFCVEVGIERVLLGHCLVEVVYDCR